MATDSSLRVLHVANGTSTLRLIEAAGILGRRSLWADPLHDGPVPGHLSDDALVSVRAQFLTGGRPAADVAAHNDLRTWRTAIANHAAYDELILWFEHDVFDQLNLIQVLTWIRQHVPAAGAVSLVSVESFPGHPRFKGLGELTPEELASLLTARERMHDAHYDDAGRMWRAFGAPSPEALDRLRLEVTPALPFLARAVGRFLQEYPWTRDGLSRSERRLLHLAEPEPIRLSSILPRMHDGEDAYFITDVSLLALVGTLSAASPPLLTVTGAVDGRVSMRQGAIALTDAGRAVLDGALDRVAACGIDRWLGGVHLEGTEAGWRWDGALDRITPAAWRDDDRRV